MHTAASNTHLREDEEAQSSGYAQLYSPNFTSVQQSMYIFNAYNESSDMQKAAADFILADNSKDALFFLRQYTLPVIGLFGIIGNILSACIFLGSNHRNTSCSLYLAARSITDTIFIVTLFIAWLDFVDVRVFHVDGICQITVFVSYVSSFLSVSFVVCITFENYIRICKPTKVCTFCTTKVAKCIMIFLLAVGVLCYNFPLWAARVRLFHDGKHYCLTLPQYRAMELVLTYTDTVLTLMIPFILVIVFLFLIFCAAVEISKRQLRLQRSRPTDRDRTTNQPHNVVTRLLTSVSLAFLVLHTPSHVIRIKVIIETIIGEYSTTTDTDRHLQYIFLTMYYLNFSINCALYLVCCQKFRTAFVAYISVCCKSDRRRAVVRIIDVSERDENERFSNGITMAEMVTDKEFSESTPFHDQESTTRSICQETSCCRQ